MASTKFTPEQLDYRSWPTVRTESLPVEDRPRFETLKSAVIAFCDGFKSGHIRREFGIVPSLLTYHVSRCVGLASDGLPRGFRQLVKGSERGDYVRLEEASPGENGSGLAGAFSMLLREEPKARRWLRLQLKPDRDGKRMLPAGLEVADLHSRFLDVLRRLGRTPDRYPFNTERLGREALGEHVRQLANGGGDNSAAMLKHGEHAIDGLSRNSLETSLFAPLVPFEKVGYDEWEIPDIATFTVVWEDGEVDVPISRCHFCPVVDFKTAAVCGYSVAIAGSFGALELLSRA